VAPGLHCPRFCHSGPATILTRLQKRRDARVRTWPLPIVPRSPSHQVKISFPAWILTTEKEHNHNCRLKLLHKPIREETAFFLAKTGIKYCLTASDFQAPIAMTSSTVKPPAIAAEAPPIRNE